MRGRFIVLEGIDGSGTTSQTEALAAALRRLGHEVLETREPSDGAIGRLIRSRLATSSEPLDPAALALLFAADRLDHVAREIEPALAAGKHVICDRYVVSSWVYQSLDCDPDWVRAINSRAPWPDRTFVLRTPVEIARARVADRREREATPEERWDVEALQRQLAAGYEAVLSDRALPGMVAVDGTAAADVVTAGLLQRCRPQLG